MIKLALCIFQLEAKRGHLGWKVTELVRKARVSRPLVYRYFGSSKKEILLGALRTYLDDHYGFSSPNPDVTLPEAIRRARERMMLFPEAILFYQKWRSKDSWLTEEFRRAEDRFQKRLTKYYSQVDEQQVVMLHAFLHGVVTAPFISPSQVEWACREFEKFCMPEFKNKKGPVSGASFKL